MTLHTTTTKTIPLVDIRGLRKRYGTLDAQMTKWKTLSNYATQQADAWKAASK